MDVIEREME